MSINFKINDIDVAAQPGEMLIAVAKRYGIDIPTLCHDERVKSYGACGMCVVEGKNGGKLMRACSTEVTKQMEGMEIYTETPRVVQARKVALELLMSDHTGDCRPPCALACPAGTDCQGYVGLIANGLNREAASLIMEKIPLPASIGRVCPHPCEDKCRRKAIDEPISIASLKRYAADVNLAGTNEKGIYAYLDKPIISSGKTVAVIGGGPAGLSVSCALRAKGHDVTIYEAMPKLGGMLRYGIPEYRLPKAVLDSEIAIIQGMGISCVTGKKIGKDISLDSLADRYDAVVVAIGAWVSSKMRIPGENLQGVYGGIDFLREIALGERPDIGKRVAVIGGGNTAMDACRSAKRLAENVSTLYRRTREEMPAAENEIQEAEDEGVVFKFLRNPVEIIGENGHATAVKAQEMVLGEPDSGGRRSPVPVEGSFEIIPVDSVIMAIGQGVDASGFEALERTRKNTIIAYEGTFETSVKGVFACGDVTNKGPGIAVAAIAEAQKCALSVDEYLNTGVANKDKIEPYYSDRHLSDADIKEQYSYREKSERAQMSFDKPEDRVKNFSEFAHGFTKEEAENEAKRCLECGCLDYFECKLALYAARYRISPERVEGAKHKKCHITNNGSFTRDMNKCILCGLCVRICEEVTGKTILGLVGRGFDTIVEPEMKKPIENTDCISCGLCVSACPTGALTEITPLVKPVPLKEETFNSVCTMCSSGCKAILTYTGSTILRSLPDKEGDMLCKRGRFLYPRSITMSDTVKQAEKDMKTIAPGKRIAVLVSSSCKTTQISRIAEFAKTIPYLGFIATNTFGKVLPDEDIDSASIASIKNGYVKSAAEIRLGANEKGITDNHIHPITEAMIKQIQNGKVDVILCFGDDMTGIDLSKTEKVFEYKLEV